jgi:hypothetical protein
MTTFREVRLSELGAAVGIYGYTRPVGSGHVLLFEVQTPFDLLALQRTVIFELRR